MPIFPIPIPDSRKAGDVVGKEFTVVGTDILRFRDGQIMECRTMSVPLEINPLS